jgi:CheY-like chemotaxis protein
VVDDNEDLRATLADVLELDGWTALQAKHGADALATLDACAAPDVIVLDLLMPVMDGREFLTRLRGHPRAGTPVVVVTGTVPRDDLGVEAVLQKPIDLPPFLELLRRIQARKRPRRHP